MIQSKETTSTSLSDAPTKEKGGLLHYSKGIEQFKLMIESWPREQLDSFFTLNVSVFFQNLDKALKKGSRTV